MGFKPSEKLTKKHKKGLWSPEEDQRLKDYILQHGIGCWTSVPLNAGLQRNGKSCRLRWINYLRPGLKRGMFSTQEEDIILNLHQTLGNKWSQIAKHLPGRTDNEIKNYWHSYLKNRAPKSKPNYTKTTPPDTPHTQETDSKGQNGQSGEQAQGIKSFLPELFFADWLPEQIYQSLSVKNGFEFTSELLQDEYVHGFWCNEGPSWTSSDNFCQDAELLQKGMVDLPYNKLHDQNVLGNGFINFSAEDVNSGYYLSSGIYS